MFCAFPAIVMAVATSSMPFDQGSRRHRVRNPEASRACDHAIFKKKIRSDVGASTATYD